jgi:hypothetical protein
MNTLIQNGPFLSDEACDGIASTALNLPIAEGKRPLIGHPYYVYNPCKTPRDPQEVQAHNHLMRSAFSVLIDKTVDYFQGLLGEEVYVDDRISLPGFHRFNVHPHHTWRRSFHVDTEKTYIAQEFPDLGVDLEVPQTTFTVLLNSHPEVSAGLSYFERPSAVTAKIFIARASGIEIDEALSSHANLHLYGKGEINVHREIIHSIYCKNESDQFFARLTFQGNLAHTQKGWLLFW